ncbi:lysyl-tRNA synthetase class 2 [Pseudochelatococcus lubricantis]|uniref:Lysyl-tRNA synthetase class 2 n=1 Tax=Pseudochelatococcus lubricantis TaxID=1538102 RepID=A0ABX0UYU6_9HYPH|nr:EF-P lysine aminoacylase EpmA [Pseudochelatococcus lubricantis]NIJ57039.1 lysyl-tRNA synthetase class 2 [Pseudochelatococcus lubricantis]
MAETDFIADSRAFFTHEAHGRRRPRLLARQSITARLRAFFAERGFIEVETPALQTSPGNEAHLHAFATHFLDGGLARRPLYLHTSPEFACKKLVAAGETHIVNFARVYRNRERSPLHHPEFTLVEWYRADEPYDTLMADCAAILRAAAEAAGTTRLRFRSAEADPFAEPQRLTVADAFRHYAGIDLLATIPDDPLAPPDRDALAAAAGAAGIRIVADDTWSDIFSHVLNQRIEPHLGHGRATVLDAYPAHEAALARRSPADPRLSERFELFVCGVELANGFGELTDPVEQRRRFMLEMDEKQRVYGERYPLDEALLALLPAMPPTSGIALGLDRLVMLATDARHIEEVLWAPLSIPQATA